LLFTIYSDEGKQPEGAGRYCRVGVSVRHGCDATTVRREVEKLRVAARSANVDGKHGELSGTRLVNRLKKLEAEGDPRAAQVESIAKSICAMVGVSIDVVIVEAPHALLSHLVGLVGHEERAAALELEVAARFLVACLAWLNLTADGLKKQCGALVVFDDITPAVLPSAMRRYEEMLFHTRRDRNYLAPVTFMPSMYDPLFDLPDCISAFVNFGRASQETRFLSQIEATFQTAWSDPAHRAQVWLTVPPNTTTQSPP
jgi:hypothetical protein